LQLSTIAPTQSQRIPVVELYAVLAIFTQLEASNPIEIHNSRTVNPAKGRLIKISIQIGHAAADKMRSRSNVQAGVVVRSLNPIDFGNFQE
jgi:hypothetical protein